ncbi:MAG: sigma-54 dependent transcriptional regulator [Candidatus Omnitrophota bacterium]|nr:sigma-54 dependent transcriptional regulator [Candidatus Omnitrophota bacterium]
MNDNHHILVVDDEPLTRQSLYEILKFEGYKVSTAQDGLEALDSIKKSPPGIIIADIKMPGMGGLQLLKEIRNNGLETAMILITGYGSIETAVEAMKEGAFDYITKPIVDSEIKVVIQKILNQQKLIEENHLLREKLAAATREKFHNIIGRSSGMQKIYAMIELVADSNATILLHGESGTGKRLITHAIHQSDPSRRAQPFIEISCGALPETLLESELFGHVKGSFTNAIKDRTGRFELADKGTVLLDEIDAFSPSLQVKLLRVLQNGEFERVGDTRTRKVDIRVIAATNQDLTQAIKNGTFREDLYYRLNVISIYIPPLRERKDDIPLLVEHFLKQIRKRAGKNKNRQPVKGISEEAIQALLTYDWPGNIRELENVIERAVILTKGDSITPEDLPEFLQEKKGTDLFSLKAPGSPGLKSLKEALKNPEKQVIQRTLEQTSWNRKKAAENLGINRTTLYNKMKEYDLLKRKGAVEQTG